MDERGCWRRPGWRAAEVRDKAQAPWTRATAEDTEALAGRGVPLGWAVGGHVTRLDIRRDCLGAPVDDALLAHMAGARGCKSMVMSQTGATLYAGSRRSAVMLRIYRKMSASSPTPPAWLAGQWEEWGWTGGDEPVTRVEFELKREALEGLTLATLARRAERDAWVQAAWADAMARIRITANPTAEYSEPNKAPAAPGWMALGAPMKKTRQPRKPGLASALEVRLARIVREYEDAGVDVGRAIALAARE